MNSLFGIYKKCNNCAYVKEFKKQRVYECHRFPPKALESSLGVYPQVRYEDWCGEWKSKED